MSEQLLPILPDDLIADNILIRLPAKSVGRFRCASKPWRSFLSSPEFARAHLKFHTHREPEGAILAGETPGFALWTLNLANKGSPSEVTLPLPLQDRDAKLVGSCHGLVLIQRGDWNMILFNPTTLETVEIPRLSYHMMRIYGLGYDSSKDDYKIVSIVKEDSGQSHVAICSVRMKTWSVVSYSPYNTFSPGGGEFVNGSIHLLVVVNIRKLAIAAFSFEREEFREVPLPCEFDGIRFWAFKKLYVAVLGGCLTVSYKGFPNVISVWVMKEYGVRDSWTKHAFSFPEYYSTKLHFVGALGEDEFLVIKSGQELVAYNWRSGVWRAFHGISSEIGASMSFRESLISPIITGNN